MSERYKEVVAGYSGLYSKIYNCINNGLVTKKSDGNYIGGLFGEKKTEIMMLLEIVITTEQ